MPKITKPKKYINQPKCNHLFVKNNGITICTKCKIKSILYLTPLL